MAGKITRRQAARVISVVYLAFLTSLAAYALSRTHALSLPISQTLTALTLALPLISGLSLETSTALASALHTNPKFSRRHARNIPAVLLPSTLTVLALVVYTTVIATLAGTHISPVGSLNCALRERWESLFRAKDGEHLGRVQEVLTCCGFRTTGDMPFPFPSDRRGVGVDECTKLWPERIGRSCEGAWRGEERMVAGVVLGVALGTFVWMAIIIAIPAIHPSWARDSLRLAASHQDGGTGTLEEITDGLDSSDPEQQQRIIEYNTHTPYTDNPGETEQDRRDRLREIASLNHDSELALQVERSRDHPGRMMREAGRNEWAENE